MHHLPFDTKTITITIILLLGLVATVVVAKQTQVFQGRAFDANEALHVTGNSVRYTGDNTYVTNSRDIQVGIKELQKLQE